MPPQQPERFRPARLADAALLYLWRRQAEHAAWYHGPGTRRAEHWHWLKTRLQNPLISILIWPSQGRPHGMVRIDSNGELAFHVADDAPDGTAQRMLQAATAYAGEHGGRLKVTLDQANQQQRDQLLAAGFREYPAVFLAWK